MNNYENFPKGSGHQARDTHLSSVLTLLATEIPTTKKSQSESKMLSFVENGSTVNENSDRARRRTDEAMAKRQGISEICDGIEEHGILLAYVKAYLPKGPTI